MQFSKLSIKKILKRTLLAAVALFGLFLVLNLLFPVPDRVEYSTIITDQKGEIVHAFLTSDQQWRMKAGLDEISPLLKKTIVEKEDKYFYDHPGVNLLAVGRALVKNIFRMRRTSGASTITMQVARMLEPRRRTYFNKLIEMFRAVQLEWKYSKDEILQLYFNLVPYGGNIQGVKAAALLYFGKDPDHLSLAEITALSIIPNRPNSLVIGKNNDRIVQERNRWLRKFAGDHIFTQKQIRDALSEPLTATRGSIPQLIPHLSYKLKPLGGTIHTFIDLNMQSKTERLVADYIRVLKLKNIHNAAVIVVDNFSHKVVTYVGSAGFYDTTDGGQVDGAAAIRQPGSTLKPLLYGLCIDGGLMTPKRVLTDVPVNYQGYAPENYDRTFKGYVTMEYALEHSLNIPAVKSLRLLGKDKMIRNLAACHFEQIKKDQSKLGLSLILGGCGATLEELTGMYSIFAHQGKFFNPLYCQRDSAVRKGDSGRRILSPAAAFMINDILCKVNRPDFPINWQSTEHLPKIAWKTGTSYGRRDAWSIGYNKHYTVGVWVGNFSARGVPDLSGAMVATPLLFKVFNNINYDADEGWFTQPGDCDIRMVCSETGLLPGDHCTNLVTDYFIPLVSSTQTCNNWEEVMVSPDEKISYCKACAPATGYKKEWYKVVPPEMQAYYDQHNIVYQKIPPHNPDCERIFRGNAPVIIAPRSRAEYLINKKHPEPLQLACHTGNDVSKVYWYINNHFYKASEAKTPQFFIPDAGPVKISCTDDKGRNRDIWIKVRYVNL